MAGNSYLSNLWNAIRSVDGSVFTYRDIGYKSATLDGFNNRTAALRNPITMGLIDRMGMYFSQTDFYLGDEENKSYNDPLIELINDPNNYQSKQDFLKEYIFQRIINGYVFVAPISPDGFERKIERVDSLYNLNAEYIQFNTNTYKTKLLSRVEAEEQNILFKYDNGNGIVGIREFNAKDIIPFFDVANGLNEDFLLNSPSKMDAILQASVNVIKAFEAQNIVIKSNGREMFFSAEKSDGFKIKQPISNDDKNEIQRKNRSYGMQHGQNRSMFLRGETGWKSLHINAKDLNLKESIEVCASAIAAAFNVPKDIVGFTDTPKYENRKEGEIALIQTVIEPIAADFCNSLNSYFGYKNNPLKYSLDHLAPMQHMELVKANKAMSLSTAFRNFTQAGVSPEQVMQLFSDLGINMMENE
jgi:phage portal protein BeeE